MWRKALAAGSVALACAACARLAPELALEHRPPPRPALPVAELAPLRLGVRVADRRETPQSRTLCHPPRRPPIRSRRAVSDAVQRALERELAARQLRVARPDQADFVLQVELLGFTCWEQSQNGLVIGGFERPTAWAQVDALVSVRRQPDERQVYWLPWRETVWSRRYRYSRPWNHYEDALNAALGRFAQGVVTHRELADHVVRAAREQRATDARTAPAGAAHPAEAPFPR
jgi:hypothetical protein